MRRWYIVICYSLLLISCRHWQDKDLFIAEVFINAKQELYLIIKNQGNTPIVEHGIQLAIYWDHEERILMQLDSLDPHFRKPGDSSIIRLPIHPGIGRHQIQVRVDTKDQVLESDEDHNVYCKSLSIDSTYGTFSCQYPILNQPFDEKNFKGYLNQGRFADLVIWREEGKTIPLVQWPKLWKQNLLDHIHAIYENRSVVYPDTLLHSFSKDTAFNIYLHYVAHSMYVEYERLVPWSVNDFAPKDLAELWDSKYYFYWDSLLQTYSLDYQSGGGIQLFHPLSTYLFSRGIQFNDQFSNSDEAIYSLLSWSRANLNHKESINLIQFQSVPSTWFPIKGQLHQVYSCWAMGGIIMDYARALNLPIRRDQIELYNGLHTMLHFPSLRRSISHADDLYDPLFYPVHQTMPVSAMMLSEEELQTVLTSKRYCLADTCHSKGSQHTYDRRKLLIKKAVDYGSGYMMILRDAGKSVIKSYLRGDEFNSLLIPMHTDQERRDLEQTMSQYDDDSPMILGRFRRYEACKNYRR